MIYFIRGAPIDAVKIGFTQSAESARGRLECLQTGFPYELRLLALLHGSRTIENSIHRCLARHRLKGEWFAWNEDVQRFMALCQEHGTWDAFDHLKAAA